MNYPICKMFFGRIFFMYDPSILTLPFCFVIDRIGIEFHCLFFTIQYEWKKTEDNYS